jgi:integrator complex subunit 6
MNEFPDIALALKEREMRAQNFLNPFDIPRSTLLDQLARMRANFFQPSPALTKLQEGCYFLINLLFLAMKCVSLLKVA